MNGPFILKKEILVNKHIKMFNLMNTKVQIKMKCYFSSLSLAKICLLRSSVNENMGAK